ncbi:LysM peptidoglycan-binding domain-containing protein [Agaribacter flavus]|uniref:LysM peptidoglycan-binding domain-containing protein n=1 Tax=Agaribacter flavus TaxID=1902781 RepID=A0ABV7FU55_9ALTE
MVKIHRYISRIALFYALALGAVLHASADIIEIKQDAPSTYVVEKGDTLWDISNLFLSKPWLWPELWRTNSHIENPHLIYPGDVLSLKYENGKPVLAITREKGTLVLTPEKFVRKKRLPIDVLPWSLIEPFLIGDQLMPEAQYHDLPPLLGDRTGTPRYAERDFILTRGLDETKALFNVMRKVREVKDSRGMSLGLQVDLISTAKLKQQANDGHVVVELDNSLSEARQGDRIVPHKKVSQKDLVLRAAKRQKGELVENANGRQLIGKNDVVIINLGKRKVKPGTVFGIYDVGTDIDYKEETSYSLERASIFTLLSLGEEIKQPAYKVGELVVFKTFELGSYALVTKAEIHMRGGEIIASP